MPQSKDILIRASDYLDYDVDMLFATAEWLATNGERKSLISNAVLEAFLIHARNLIEFLSGVGRGNAVRAHHYFEGLPEGTYSPKVSPFLISTKDKISTHLAHLTTEPLDDLRSKIGWDVRRILLELWEGLKVFYEDVPSESVLPNYDRRYDEYKVRIQSWLPESRNRMQGFEGQTADTDFI